MPNIPNINPQVSGPSVGSVGRMSINAPVEAFGGGRAASGLAQVGRGLQGIGQGVQDIAQQQEQTKKRSTAVKADQGKLAYKNRMNKWIADNNGRQDVEQMLSDYTKEREAAKKESLSMVGDDVEIASVLGRSIDESESSYRNHVMNQAADTTRSIEKATRKANFESSENKLMIASNELKTNADIIGWFEMYGDDYNQSMKAEIAATAPELREARAKELSSATFSRVFDNLSEDIADHDDPETYKLYMDLLADKFAEGGMFDEDTKDQLKERSSKRLASRMTADENKRNEANKTWRNNKISMLDAAKNNPAQRKLLLDEAKDEASLFATSSDKTGKTAYEKIVNANNAYDAPRETGNKLLVEETLFSQGREAAEALLEKMEAGRTFTTEDGRKVTVSDINGEQAAALRVKFEKHEESVRNSWKLDAIKRVRKLSDEGKLYAFQHEGFARPMGESLLQLVAPGIKIPRDQSFEPLWDKTKPEKGLQVGESLSVFNRGVPLAADWDQHQIRGEKLENLVEYMDKWANENNITQKSQWDQHLREKLIPLEKEAALMKYDSRLLLDEPESSTIRGDITANLYKKTEKELAEKKQK